MLASHHRALDSVPGNYAWLNMDKVILEHSLHCISSILLIAPYLYTAVLWNVWQSCLCSILSDFFLLNLRFLSLWPAAGYTQNLEKFLSTHANWKHHNEVNVFGLHCCHQSNHTAQMSSFWSNGMCCALQPSFVVTPLWKSLTSVLVWQHMQNLPWSFSSSVAKWYFCKGYHTHSILIPILPAQF